MPASNFLSQFVEPGLVSVIIPTYNRAHLIGETIDSLLAQTYQSFEAIIVDDGSTDNTREVVARYADPRIRYQFKSNGGLSSARNFGFDVARGEFIAFLDSDDLWASWKLAAQVAIFRRHADVGMIWTDMSTFAEHGRVLKERHLRQYYAVYDRVDVTTTLRQQGVLGELISEAPPMIGACPYYTGDVFEMMFVGNLIHPPTAIIRRTRLQDSGPFEPEITGDGAEDYHFYLKVTERGPVAFLDAPAILYRVHPNQMSTMGNLAEARGDLRVIEHWVRRRPSAMSGRQKRDRFANSHAWVGTTQLEEGRHLQAIKHLVISISLGRVNTSNLLYLAASLCPPAVLSVAKHGKRALRLKSRPKQLATLALGLSGILYLLYLLSMVLPIATAEF